jgi:ABC-type cobalamin/Fe3+-siderophores transport system ATPase subunit
MIESISIENLGPLRSLDWEPGPGFNLVIGENASGKTLLLKALYATVRAIEEFRRGDDTRTFRQVLDDKLTWTFQLTRLGDLVSRGAGSSGPCDVLLKLDGKRCKFKFTSYAEKGVGDALFEGETRGATSIFIPAKEVMSTLAVIKESRAQQKFGFDDPTYDLIRALESVPSRGKPPFGKARAKLEKFIGGRLQEHSVKGWVFQTSRYEYPVAITAEGIKKIAIIDRLIVNRTLSNNSILLIDEPESFLHPRAVVQVLDILHHLVEDGVQIFLATHSYFVLRKLYLLARQKKMSIPVLSMIARGEDRPTISDLIDGMPENPIVDMSIQLYEEELEIELNNG